MQPWLAQTYDTHRRGLYALALSVLRRPELAEDAVHDAFAKMARLKATPEGDNTAYAFAAVRNAALDIKVRQAQLGRGGRGADADEIRPIDLLAAKPESDPIARAQLAEDRTRVQTALSALSDEDREVILLRLWSNLSFQQISDACRLPLGTIASRYYRALAQLKLRLSDLSSSALPAKETRHVS